MDGECRRVRPQTHFLIILTIFTDLSVDERAQSDAAGPSVFNCWISIALVFSCMYC